MSHFQTVTLCPHLSSLNEIREPVFEIFCVQADTQTHIDQHTGVITINRPTPSAGAQVGLMLMNKITESRWSTCTQVFHNQRCQCMHIGPKYFYETLSPNPCCAMYVFSSCRKPFPNFFLFLSVYVSDTYPITGRSSTSVTFFYPSHMPGRSYLPWATFFYPWQIISTPNHANLPWVTFIYLSYTPFSQCVLPLV